MNRTQAFALQVRHHTTRPSVLWSKSLESNQDLILTKDVFCHYTRHAQKLERSIGFEPIRSAWKADMLAVNISPAQNWLRQWESDPTFLQFMRLSSSPELYTATKTLFVHHPRDVDDGDDYTKNITNCSHQRHLLV